MKNELEEFAVGYLNDTMRRASVQSLRDFFLYGVDGEEHSAKGYEARIKKADDMWRDAVKEYAPEGEDSMLYCAISNAISEHEHVYMEVGIQTGFRLAEDIGKSGEDDILCGSDSLT